MSRNSVGVSSVEMGIVSTNGILALSRLLLDGRVDDEGRTLMLEEVFVPLEPATAIGDDALAHDYWQTVFDNTRTECRCIRGRCDAGRIYTFDYDHQMAPLNYYNRSD
eukprot:scaffold178690_cov53-Attheya_sp.AAC.5